MTATAQRTVAGRSLAVNALIVMGALIISRVLGLIREMVIAALFGTSGQYDAYVAAFRIPDTLFLLVIGGALSSAFIPVFVSHLSKDDNEEAWRLASSILTITLLVFVVAAILAAILAPQLIDWVIAPGLSPWQKELATSITRLLLLSPLFLGLGGISMGILQSHHRFLTPAIGPITYNLLIILGGLFLTPYLGVYGLATGVVIGAASHFLVQVPSLIKVGIHYVPRLGLWRKDVRDVGRLLLPRLFGQAAVQINFIVITNIASHLTEGSISALNYAYLLMSLPLGVSAISLSTVIFPTLARQFGTRDMQGFKATLASTIRVGLFLTMPASIGLILLREPIVRLLFQFYAFTERSTEMVSWALLFFAAGLFAFAVIEIVTRAFYAMHDTRTPVIIALLTIAINIGLSLALAPLLGYGGLALSLTATSVLEMILLVVMARRRLRDLDDRATLVSIFRTCAAGLAMGVVLYAMVQLKSSLDLQPRSIGEFVWIVGSIGLAGGVYLIEAVLLRSEEVHQAFRMLRRGRNSSG
ncbi:MAG: murein biosynthesis integral membrane protein MurJ [Chloroflexi bacterium]|nr:murein biosynthesis integral membrane protein MurJ [Chloroflexota bacterium]